MAEMVVLAPRKVYRPRKSARERDCKKLYRFEEANIQWLANHFLGEEVETRGGALSPVQKMKVFLRFLADPGFQSGIGEELGIHQSSVSRTITYVLNCVLDKANTWIKFPDTQESAMQAKEAWLKKYRFPTAIGALDCTHIRIQKPAVHGDEYINRKGVPSLNIQATCDQNYTFTSIEARWPGSVHDSRIWRNSPVRQLMQRTTHTVLLGDSGYGIQPWLMTPFINPVNDAQKDFNTLLTRERVIIECSFGQLKRRFPILQYTCRVELAKIPKVVVACAVLHNIAKYLGDEDFPEDDEELVLQRDLPPAEEETTDAIRARGSLRRHELAELIHNNNLAGNYIA